MVRAGGTDETQTTVCEGDLCSKPNSQPVTLHEINDVGRNLCEVCASPLGHVVLDGA
jgi:hypothetical protein